ncbi:MAG: hypothetical protein GWP18_05265 [Proteobacteria bacterium]|nr:hypothetical protein [Pseudomonadota bacterium]
MAPFLVTTDSGPVRTLTMSNPGRKNAVPPGEWASFERAFSEFETSNQRVLVITGANGDFSAGAMWTSQAVVLPRGCPPILRARHRRTDVAARLR